MKRVVDLTHVLLSYCILYVPMCSIRKEEKNTSNVKYIINDDFLGENNKCRGGGDKHYTFPTMEIFLYFNKITDKIQIHVGKYAFFFLFFKERYSE